MSLRVIYKNSLFVRAIINSFVTVLIYFISGVLLISDTAPMIFFYIYFPIEIAAFGIGWGGGTTEEFLAILLYEFFVIWMLLGFVLLIIGLVKRSLRKSKI